MLGDPLASRDLSHVAARIARLVGRDDGLPELAFQPLPDGGPPRRVAAVDGSNGVVADGHAFVVAAYRAGGVVVSDGAVERRVAPPRVAVVEAGEGGALVDEALGALGLPPAGKRMGPEAAVDALRALEEARVALELAGELSRGDVLLLDGALQAREPAPPRALLERVLETASDRGVAVVGVCKSTSHRLAGGPLLSVVDRCARRHAPAGPWACEVPRPNGGVVARVHAARLNPAQRRLFRFDVAPRVDDPCRVLGALAPLATNPGYPGYPYPLALAHNAVVLDERVCDDLAHRLRRGAEAAGLPGAEWDRAFADFHDVLDAGA